MADSHKTNTTSPQERPARPRLALRIGITGMRSLDAERVKEALPSQLHSVLDLAWSEMKALAKDKKAIASYEGGDGDLPVPFEMRFLSPLARGADRLAAKAAHGLGYKLFVPMPFPQAEYEKDFTGSDETTEPKDPELSKADLDEFHDLLKLADEESRLELDGGRKEENRAYENVGRFVVRNSDLLIAIWDGNPEGRGRGGTAEIVHYAARNGVPVWWIHATKQCDPVWIGDIQDLRDLCCDIPLPETKNKENCRTLLSLYLKGQIRPPPAWDRHRQCLGPMKWLARLGVEPVSLATLVKGLLKPNPPEPRKRLESGWETDWNGLFHLADNLAIKNVTHYRHTYLWLFRLAAAALVLGAFALFLQGVEWEYLAKLEVIVAWLEFFVLLWIAIIVLRAMHFEWHERSIEFRLFAELCRTQRVLGLLGRTIPLVAVRHFPQPDLHALFPDRKNPPYHGALLWAVRFLTVLGCPPLSRDATETSYRSAWVGWLFTAYLRAAPLPCGVIAEALPEIRSEDVLDKQLGLITVQLRYHLERCEVSSNKGRIFDLSGQWAFVAAVFFVVLKLSAIHLQQIFGHDFARCSPGFGFSAIVLAAISAALVGIRGYEELPLLAEQSKQMFYALDNAGESVKALNLACPMASQDLGDEIYSVAKLMLRDLEDWELLIRTKEIEL
jgi:hypothetical protein